MNRITVTALDDHPVDGHPGSFHDRLKLGTGKHLIVSAYGVYLDGNEVLARDRRAKKNRIPGHPFIQATTEGARAWTSFSIDVEP